MLKEYMLTLLQSGKINLSEYCNVELSSVPIAKLKIILKEKEKEMTDQEVNKWMKEFETTMINFPSRIMPIQGSDWDIDKPKGFLRGEIYTFDGISDNIPYIWRIDTTMESPKYSMFIEEEKVFKQEIVLPGVKKEDISIKVTASKFTLELKEGSKFFSKGYKVEYSLPKYGKVKELKATLTDGILTIIVPKKIVEFEVKVQ